MKANRSIVGGVLVVVVAVLNSQCTKAPDAKAPAWKAILSETLIPGQGLGKIRVAEPAFPLITEVLGSANTVTQILGREIHTYGEDPSNPQLKVYVTPPGRDGKVEAIYVNSTFQGSTSQGIRMGDSLNKVLERHGRPKLRGKNLLIYADGTVFRFTDPQQLRMMEVWDPRRLPY